MVIYKECRILNYQIFFMFDHKIYDVYNISE